MAGTERTVRVKFKGDSSGLDNAALTGEKAMSRWSDKMGKLGEKAGKQASDGFGKGTAAIERDAQSLDRRILESQQVIHGLAQEIARTSDDVKRNNLWRSLRDEQAKMGRDVKVRNLLPNPADLAKAGGDAGSALSAGMIREMGQTLAAAGPIMKGAGIAAAVASAPFIGAALSGGIIAGMGVGTLGLGAMLLKDEPQVKAAATSLMGTAKAVFTDAAGPLVEPVTESLHSLSRTAQDVAPELSGAFADAAPSVGSLTRGISGLVKSALPGFRSGVRASGQVLDEVGASLPGLGADFGYFFERIGGQGDDAATAIGDAFHITGEGIKDAADAIATLTDWYGKYSDTVSHLAPAVGGLGRLFDGMPGPLGYAGDKMKVWSDANDGATKRMRELDPALRGGAAAFGGIATSTDIARLAVEAFRRTQTETTDANLSAAESALAYREAVTTAAAAVDHKRRVSDEEEASLLRLARAGNSDITVMQNQNATGAQLSARHKQLHDDFVKTAIKMGYTKTEAEKLAAQYLKIPKSIDTTARLLGANAAINTAKTLKAALEKLPKEKRIKLSVYQEGGDAGITVRTDKGGKARFAGGGYFQGRGSGTSDSNPAWLSDGEYIIRNAAVRALGVNFLDELNNAGPGQGARSYLDAPMAAAGPGAGAAPSSSSTGGGARVPEIRVFIGERELTDIVRVEVSESNRGTRRRVLAGVGAGGGR